MTDSDSERLRGQTRREVIRCGGAMLAAVGLTGCAKPQAPFTREVRQGPLERVRVGFVGAGARGSGLCQILMLLEGVEIKAICDIDASRVATLQKMAQANKLPTPDAYTDGPDAWRRLCERDDIDLVVIATPWELHAPMCLVAMNAGKHAAVEVPAALTAEECWQLVETAEKTRRHCMMLENVCYFRNVMAVLNMVRQGVFGEIMHCEGGYQHDLIAAGPLLFDRKGKLTWRGEHYARRNGNLYPTHPIGPIAQWMDINRGDRFDYLVSVSSRNSGLTERYLKNIELPAGRAPRTFASGDINTTILRTVNGHTVTLYYDTQLPRPADMILRVQGTRGLYIGSIDKIYLEGMSPAKDTWEPWSPYQEKYDHPLWRAQAEKAKGHSHGGGDYLTLYRLIEALRRGSPLDMDVYDAATWSVISPLTEKSAAERGRSVDVPDFTRGAWKTRPPVRIDVA